MSTLRVSLPVPPSTNNLYATVRGRRVLTTEAREYKAHVGRHAFAASVLAHWRYQQPARLRVAVAFWYPNRRRRDIDNLKALIDGLAAGLGFDDCVIDDLRITRAGIDKDNPRVEVEVSSY